MPVRLTRNVVTIGGNVIDNVLNVRCSFGWDQSDSNASIEMYGLPASWAYGNAVTINIGEVGNVPRRFTGYLREWDYSHYPVSVTAICGGPLYRLDQYENVTDTDEDGTSKPGIDIDTITGNRTATLRQIVIGVLGIVGVSYNIANFANPSHVYGLIGPEVFTWHVGETALAYLHRLFEASEGYRLFGSGDGTIYLAQIAGQPSGSADLTLSEGTDIISGTSKHSTIKTKGSILVTGYDDGGGAATATAGDDDPPFRVNSQLIEDDSFAGTIAAYWFNELGNILVTTELDTWRLDVMGPAQTHHVQAPIRLGIDANYYVVSNSIEMNDHGMITQHVSYIGHESM